MSRAIQSGIGSALCVVGGYVLGSSLAGEPLETILTGVSGGVMLFVGGYIGGRQ